MKEKQAASAAIDAQRLFRDCVIFTLVFGLAAHAYCYFNLTLSHDALFSLYRQDMAGQIQLGRFMHVPYMALRGSITAPALVGFLSLVFLCGASYLTVRLLAIRSRLFVALTCGILATNIAFTFTNASYLHESDMYMLALLLACAAVWCCRRWRHGWVLGGVLAALSLGFYQAYLSVAFMLFVMITIGRVLDGTPPKRVLTELLPMLGTAVLGFALYLAAVFGTVAISGVELTSGYNGVGGAGDFSSVSIPSLIAHAWLYPIRSLVFPEGMYPQLMGVVNIVVSVAALGSLAWLAKKAHVSVGGIAIIVALLLFTPFVANYVYIISKGVIHALMVYAFCYWFVFAIQLQQRVADAKGWERGYPGCEQLTDSFPTGFGIPGALMAIVSIGCAFIILFGVVFANQAYFKKQLQFETTELTVNRVLDRVEQVDGYKPGETPVYLAGSLHDSPLIAERVGFQDVRGTGFFWQTAITYDEACYFSMVLGYPINLLNDAQAAERIDMDAVERMGVFPATDSVAMVDGVAVVRLSDDLIEETEET